MRRVCLCRSSKRKLDLGQACTPLTPATTPGSTPERSAGLSNTPGVWQQCGSALKEIHCTLLPVVWQ